MNWLDKLEQKWGNKGIPNITTVFLITTLFGTLIMYAAAAGNTAAGIFYNLLAYNPNAILHGQVWRLFTWIFMPINSLSFWSLLFMLCLFMLGKSLESGLGTFKMNVYFIGGWLLNTLGGLIIYLIFHVSIYLTPYYLLFSLYLMLGIFMPEAEMRLYFVLPIRMKWLVIVYFVELAYEIYSYFSQGAAVGIALSAQIVFAIINLLVFVSACKNHLSVRNRRKQHKRQQQYQRQFSTPRPGSGITHHKCSICGRTELDDPNLTFRYCSKCEGKHEFCQDHLFTHQHFRMN